MEFKLTKDCIISVLKSKYPNFDILVIDNGSLNNSLKKLKHEFLKIKNIRFKRSKKNLYFAGGFNFGAKIANGEYIILLSNDITVDPYWIDELIKYTDQKTMIQPRIMKYFDKKVIDNVGGRYNIFGMGMGIAQMQDNDDEIRDVDFASATTLLINRIFFLKLGGYDPWFRSHYEDVDLSLRAKKNGGRCIVSFKSIIYHKGSETYKKHAIPESTLIDVRKNRVRTIVKNFDKVEKYGRLILCLAAFFPAIIQDLLRRSEYKFLTIKSILRGLSKS